jgi:hypothetical protein
MAFPRRHGRRQHLDCISIVVDSDSESIPRLIFSGRVSALNASVIPVRC